MTAPEHTTEVPLEGLPQGWSARIPDADDVAPLSALASAYHRAVRGSGKVNQEAVAALVIGSGSWTRRQLVVADEAGELQAWASVHDRAAGRTMIELYFTPGHSKGDQVAPILLEWIASGAREIAELRQLESTQLDASPHAADERLKRWLTDAGYRKQRTWLQLTRGVEDADELRGERPGVVVRRVAKHDNGKPVASDIQVVHLMLEESFADHFNSYRESFPEFLQRLREDPGHRWDHWWIAEIEEDGELLPGGALVASVMWPDPDGIRGSYVDYIGVHQRARGKGVAKALLETVIKDAHERGRNRVDLEVDADSPTGADGLYSSMGWTLSYVTESWHGEVEAAPAG